MHTRALIIAGLIVVVSLAAGCGDWKPFDKEPSATTEATADADVAVTAEPMTATATDTQPPEVSPALTQTEQDLAALQEAYASLEGKHRQLTEKAEEMEWVNDQLLQTIRDLDSTIEERDRLTLTVEQLRVDNMRLTETIEQMESELSVYRDQLETFRQVQRGEIEAPTDAPSEPDSQPEADVEVPEKPELPSE